MPPDSSSAPPPGKSSPGDQSSGQSSLLNPAKPAPEPKAAKPDKSSGWPKLNKRANTVASIVALFAFLVAGGAAIGYYYSASKNPPTTAKKSPAVQTLSQSDLNKLGTVGQNLGSGGQVLSISADALFRGQASVVGDLTVGGQLHANGPVSLSQLTITGNAAGIGLNVNSNANVTGTTTLQGALTVAGLANFNGGINVSGAASVGSLNAGSIAVRNIAISGPLTIGHLVTQGLPPTIAANQDGAGGTVSISGNDTAGQVNINTGSGPGATLATITFRATYGASVHVELTPLTAAAASAQAYVTRNNGGFQVHAVAPGAGQVLSYDYLVTQ